MSQHVYECEGFLYFFCFSFATLSAAVYFLNGNLNFFFSRMCDMHVSLAAPHSRPYLYI